MHPFLHFKKGMCIEQSLKYYCTGILNLYIITLEMSGASKITLVWRSIVQRLWKTHHVEVPVMGIVCLGFHKLVFFDLISFFVCFASS